MTKDRPIAYDEVSCPVLVLVGPCHVFRGAKIGNGYGNVWVGKKSMLVHRLVWEREVGPIPDGMRIDHLCGVKACCNVKHLRVVTHKANTTENSASVGAKNKAKTHCPKGHAYDKTDYKGARRCRTCHNDFNREYHRRRRGA